MNGTPHLHGPASELELGGTAVEAGASLRRLYRGYCKRQITSLLSLLPREGVRPLYRTARRWAVERGCHEAKDPLATLLRYCETVLPLPPFPVWLEDFRRHRGAYLEELDAAPGDDEEELPVTMDCRSLEADGRRWYAALAVFRREGAWRGYVSFRAEASDTSVRTADIFRSHELTEIRDRFREFDGETLRAFLRSTLP